MTDVLIRFSGLLRDTDARILTPSDLNITAVPEENGTTPAENAAVKAAFYSRYCDRVLCNDSGLYISDLPLSDPRQPGMHVRSPGGERLDDDGMIAYYAALAQSLGGRMTACYLDGVAVCCQGVISTYMDEEEARNSAFYMLCAPHPIRHPGWPLDSLSISPRTGRYFVEETREDAPQEDNVIFDAYWQKLRAFLLSALKLG